MAVVTEVKMRELLRESKSVFEALERSGEPVVLTRDGRAIAVLFPVDRDQAVEIAMAALPEFVQSRNRARNARSEGRTASAAEFLQEFESRHGTDEGAPPATPAPELVPADEGSPDSRAEMEAALVEDLKVLFGEELSREFASGVKERIAVASEPVLDAAPREIREQDVGSSDFAQRVQQLNYELFGRLLPDELHRTTLDLLASQPLRYGHPEQRKAGGVFGRLLAEQTLDAVTARVKSFNLELLDMRLVGQTLSLPVYEAFVRGAQAIERVDAPTSAPELRGSRS
jgi:antitoxin (DNA-binding transcriptional repressor) of toxin-antitoxin stability system